MAFQHIMFSAFDLGYLHKNNNDQDALDLKRKNRNEGMMQITDRNEYLKQLKEKIVVLHKQLF